MTLPEELAWFEKFRGTPRFADLAARPIAYFCAEFALRGDLPIYSGGLGVLAGDVVREAADRGLPMLAVGLYYTKGYICKMKEDGVGFMEVCEDHPAEALGLEPVVAHDGKRIEVTVPLGDRSVVVQAWRQQVGSVPVYLLDTNLSANQEADRRITDRLYVGDKETRLKQELVLGIGGLRFLEALGEHPLLYHLNEGHSAFLALELIRHQMKERGLGFQEAKQFARRRMLFTNHTLVPAGNEIYDGDLVSLMVGPYCQSLGIPVQDVVALGLVHQSSSFSMTMLSLRMASVVNGVSKLHATKAREVWTDHPMIGITNGVHAGTWDALAGRDLQRPGAFWSAHRERKSTLLAAVKEWSGRDWSPDDLLLGWARRIAGYKRPLAVLEDTARIARIARQTGRAVRVILSGRPHPNDADGVKMLDAVRQATEGELKDIAVYLPDYGMDRAKLLVGGCDVWLNTPVIGFEASGTSGMKAALNGVLPCTTRDGWVAEVELYGVGWALESERIGASLMDVLESNIVPMYYERDANGVPVTWERHMRNARTMVLDRFTATRMLREYSELLYL
jgi:starch phosphorylase